MPIIDIPNGNSAKQILLEGEVVTFLLYFTENERTSNNRFQPKACLTKSLFIICATTFLWRDSPQSAPIGAQIKANTRAWVQL